MIDLPDFEKKKNLYEKNSNLYWKQRKKPSNILFSRENF